MKHSKKNYSNKIKNKLKGGGGGASVPAQDIDKLIILSERIGLNLNDLQQLRKNGLNHEEIIELLEIPDITLSKFKEISGLNSKSPRGEGGAGGGSARGRSRSPRRHHSRGSHSHSPKSPHETGLDFFKEYYDIIQSEIFRLEKKKNPENSHSITNQQKILGNMNKLIEPILISEDESGFNNPAFNIALSDLEEEFKRLRNITGNSEYDFYHSLGMKAAKRKKKFNKNNPKRASVLNFNHPGGGHEDGGAHWSHGAGGGGGWHESTKKEMTTSSALALANKHKTHDDPHQALQRLLIMFKNEMPSASLELEQMVMDAGKHKKGHWMWWCFPTSVKGRSDDAHTFLTHETANEFLLQVHAMGLDKEWIQCIHRMYKVIQHEMEDGLKTKKINDGDRGRLYDFCNFWNECIFLGVVNESPLTKELGNLCIHIEDRLRFITRRFFERTDHGKWPHPNWLVDHPEWKSS